MSSETPAAEDALEADHAGSTLLAASLCEELLETGHADLDVLLNLAVL